MANPEAMTDPAGARDDLELFRRAALAAAATGSGLDTDAWTAERLAGSLSVAFAALDERDRLLSRITELEKALGERSDVEAHLRGIAEGPDTYPTPAAGWTCFHCGETFRTARGASLHFGDHPRVRSRPLCQGDKSVIAFATAVLHGDDEHRAWLLEAASAFVAGTPLPPVRAAARTLANKDG